MPIDLIRLWDLSTRYTAAWCSQNPATVAAFYSHDGSLTVNDGFPAVGRNAITELAQSFMTAFPDLCVVMDNLVLQDDEAEHYRTLTGNKSVPGSAGRRVRISGVEKWRLGGKRLDRLLAGSLRYG
ncbi:MAG: nuclear transport factor 2 family protein, partial [Terriglobia bacterium]